MKTTRVRKTYLNRVRTALPCFGTAKRAILRQLGEDVDTYLAEHSDANGAELEAALGSPETFGEDYLASLETEQLQALIRRAKRRKGIVIGVCCGLLALLLAWGAYTLINLYLHMHDSYFVTEVIVDERIEDDDSIENTESEAVAP